MLHSESNCSADPRIWGPRFFTCNRASLAIVESTDGGHLPAIPLRDVREKPRTAKSAVRATVTRIDQCQFPQIAQRRVSRR